MKSSSQCVASIAYTTYPSLHCVDSSRVSVLQDGVVGKEARCPSQQGEVSYTQSLPYHDYLCPMSILWYATHSLFQHMTFKSKMQLSLSRIPSSITAHVMFWLACLLSPLTLLACSSKLQSQVLDRLAIPTKIVWKHAVTLQSRYTSTYPSYNTILTFYSPLVIDVLASFQSS